MGFIVSKITTLLEQTLFLVEKEKEAFLEISKRMDLLFSLLQEKIGQFKDEESKETLVAIEKHLIAHFDEMKNSMKEDVAFLEQQLQTMKQVSLIDDEQRRNELAEMIIHEAGELLPTETFKKNIEEQSQMSRDEFFAMIQEMEDAIQEGKEEELLLLMESADEEDEEGCCGSDECADDECDEDYDEDDDADDESDDECCKDKNAAQNVFTNDLVGDLERALKTEQKECKRGRPGCGGQCTCKRSCDGNA